MTNHVHLIVTPAADSDLGRAIGETHRRYTRMVNRRNGWTGYLWQGRFASFPMDEAWLLRAAAYVELNPVRADMVAQAWDYPWSSARAHLAGSDPLGVVNPEPLLALAGDWREYLASAVEQDVAELEKHQRTGRPLGDEQFVSQAETLLGRLLRKRKPGPRSRQGADN